ncbi:MAG: hypothetical protein J6334_12030, partial [Kiritimatiellae bacterium]|nr:hypothetical protein [Kiritimatiellia bacterium]
IEFGFISNNGEAGEMLSAPWQEAHARLVADAVTDYAKRIETLDRAVAQRAEEERKANEAWRAKLAKREAEKRARLATARTAAPPPPGDAAHQSLAAPFPLAPFPDDATPPPAPKPVVVERATNTAPLVVGRLIDFYMKEKPNE